MKVLCAECFEYNAYKYNPLLHTWCIHVRYRICKFIGRYVIHTHGQEIPRVRVRGCACIGVLHFCMQQIQCCWLIAAALSLSLSITPREKPHPPGGKHARKALLRLGPVQLPILRSRRRHWIQPHNRSNRLVTALAPSQSRVFTSVNVVCLPARVECRHHNTYTHTHRCAAI